MFKGTGSVYRTVFSHMISIVRPSTHHRNISTNHSLFHSACMSLSTFFSYSLCLYLSSCLSLSLHVSLKCCGGWLGIAIKFHGPGKIVRWRLFVYCVQHTSRRIIIRVNPAVVYTSKTDTVTMAVVAKKTIGLRFR